MKAVPGAGTKVKIELEDPRKMKDTPEVGFLVATQRMMNDGLVRVQSEMEKIVVGENSRMVEEKSRMMEKKSRMIEENSHMMENSRMMIEENSCMVEKNSCMI